MALSAIDSVRELNSELSLFGLWQTPPAKPKHEHKRKAEAEAQSLKRKAGAGSGERGAEVYNRHGAANYIEAAR
jgi:hypothetical protein